MENLNNYIEQGNTFFYMDIELQNIELPFIAGINENNAVSAQMSDENYLKDMEYVVSVAQY